MDREDAGNGMGGVKTCLGGAGQSGHRCRPYDRAGMRVGKGRVQGWTPPAPVEVVRRGCPNHSRDWRLLRGLQTGGLGTQVTWLLLKPMVSDPLCRKQEDRGLLVMVL